MLKSKRFYIYTITLVAWVVLTSVIINLEYRLALQKAEADFNERIEHLYEKIESIARDNEAILEGFSAFLSAIEDADRDSASRYARQILTQYPHVYQLEVVLVVKHKELGNFISRQRSIWFPEFRVNSLNLNSGRIEKGVRNEPAYYPIIFIEPLLPISRQKIGVDVGSEPVLRDALIQATESKSAVATLPFNFGEGPREYALFRPVPDPPKGVLAKRKPALALLEVNIEAILQKITPLSEDLDVVLYHGDYPSTFQKSVFFHIEPSIPSSPDTKFFPKLVAERKLDRGGQSFALSVNKQLHWFDFELALPVMTVCASLLSLILFLLFLSGYYRREKRRIHAENRFRHMATHDALTGLPNRVLLADRFTQACSRSNRRNSPFSVMFIDMNDFKKVNDSYGHKVGDQLLKSFGNMLKACIRSEDTLSRISGDEFVILLEDTSYEKAQLVARKIQEKLAKPILISDIELVIGFSVGIAVFPTDGTMMGDLLVKADERMYQDKEQKKAMSALNVETEILCGG